MAVKGTDTLQVQGWRQRLRAGLGSAAPLVAGATSPLAAGLGAAAGTTWTWDGSKWTRLSQANGPVARSGLRG